MVVSPVSGSLFAPFFFPLGIAFMGAQSAVMMKMAGENWQYGKRRISAMSNEDFNKMSPVQLYQLETQELQAIIPSIEKSLQSMTPLTATIVTEMINTFKVGAQATLAYIQDISDTPIGKVVLFAINAWMPWLNPLLKAGGGIPDFGEIDQPDQIQAIHLPSPSLQKSPPKIHKTTQQINQQNVTLKKHIVKVTKDPIMEKYTTLLADISKTNQLINGLIRQVANKQYPNRPSLDLTKLQNLRKVKATNKLKLSNFMKNNRRWGSANNLF